MKGFRTSILGLFLITGLFGSALLLSGCGGAGDSSTGELAPVAADPTPDQAAATEAAYEEQQPN